MCIRDRRVAAIHGGLTQRQRDRAMDQFIYGDCMALVATDVAARGIDVDGVQAVIHWDPPENGKAYKHRSGRTARAGATGTVVSLLQKKDKGKYNRIQKEVGIKYQVGDPDLGKIPENELDYIPPPRPKREYQQKNPRNRRQNRRRRRPPSGKSDEPKKFGGKNKRPKRNDKIKFPREEDRPKRRKQPSYPDRSGGRPPKKKENDRNEPSEGRNRNQNRRNNRNRRNSGRKPYNNKRKPSQNKRSGGKNQRNSGKKFYDNKKKPSQNKKRDNKSQRNSKKMFFSSKRKR